MAENVEVVLRIRGSRAFVQQASAAAQSVDRIGDSTDDTSKKAGKFGSVLRAGFAAGAVGIGALALGAKNALAAFEESRKVTAQTGAVIKSTGGAAKITATQVGDLAGALSKKTGIDDELIQSGENVLLTFSKIRNETGKGNDIFNQTTGIMADMSAALGQDTKSSAMQLGKALNNPTKGVAALQRVGVAFTESQKKQIARLQESGRTMDAQKIILKELGSEFGGSAAAQATATDKMKVAWGNAMESIGGALAPVVDQLLTGLIPVVDKVGPMLETFMGQLKSGEGAGGKVASGFRAIGAAMQAAYAVGKFLVANWREILVIAGALAIAYVAVNFQLLVLRGAMLIATVTTKALAVATRLVTAAQWLWNAAMTANPIGLVIAGIVLLVATFIIMYRKVGWFRAGVTAAFRAIKGAALAAFNWIKTNWPLIISILGGPIGIAVALVIRNFDRIKKAASGVVNWIKTTFGRVKSIIAGIFSGDFVAGIGRGLANWLNSNTPFGDRIEFTVLGKSVGFTIPALATGGTIAQGGAAVVGERGPEIVHLPRAAEVVPNSAISLAGAGTQTIITQVFLDRRQIAEAIGNYTSDRIARR